MSEPQPQPQPQLTVEPAVDMDAIKAFIYKYLGARYDIVPSGPMSFNCWTWVRTTQWELFGRELPEIPIGDDQITTLIKTFVKERQKLNWVVIPKPIHGCIVEMSHAGTPHHIGTWLDVDGGGISHCLKGAGVAFNSLLELRASGWRRFIYEQPT